MRQTPQAAGEPVTAQPAAKRPRAKTALWAAAILSLGVFSTCWIGLGGWPDAMDWWTVIFGIPGTLVFGAIAFALLLWPSGKLPRWAVIGVAAFLAAGSIAWSAWDSRPAAIFARQVLSPVPPSVKNLSSRTITYFNGPWNFGFQFDADPSDFNRIADHFGMWSVTDEFIPHEEYVRQRDWIEELLRIQAPGPYTRPIRATFWKDQDTYICAVRDEDSGHVFLLVRHPDNPKP